MLLLGGCGEDEGSTPESNFIAPPVVRDAFEVLSKDEDQTTVSLKDAAIDPQGLPLTLESVVATGQGCEAPSAIDAQALTFTVTNTEPELCFYRYSVKNHPAQASLAKASEANSYVLKSASEGDLLPPLSETTQVGTPITINIAAVTGYTLDSEVVVLGDGGAVVDSAASTIAYTPNAQGVTRLIYTMTNDDETEMMTGTIDVAVSDVGNTAPNVEPIELNTQPGSEEYFNIDETYTIDLSDYVSDADGDDVQLIQVEAWNANVALAAPEDPANLAFTFQTSTLGAHYVTYVVSDHRGGYAVQQVRIEVYDLSSIADWEDIQQGAKLFSAPLTISEALVSGASFSGSHIDSNGATVATFDFEQAQAFCTDKGGLPTSTNLTELSAFEGGPASKGWPVDVAFWANDGGTSALVNLATGSSVTEASPGGQYVTCLNEGGFTVDTDNSDFEAVADGADSAVVAVKLTFDGNPIEGQVMTASSSSMDVVIDSTNGTTNADGLASFVLTSLKAGDIPVEVEYSGETLTQMVTFVADEATADIALITTEDGASYGSTDGNEVQATITDINDNPLVGQGVTFESDASVTITPSGTETSADGTQTAAVVWDGEILTEDTTVDVTARFTPASTGTEMSDTTSVTFVSTMPTICGGEVNDADKANAAGNCLKVATDDADNWFTSTPSQAVMEALKYTQSNAEDNTGDTYAAINAEDDTHGPAGVIFARFRQDGDGVLNPDVGGTGDNGQLHRWCQKLSDINFGGKDYWRRPTAEELSGLYSHAGNLWENLGWPTGNRYWTSTISDVNRYNRIDLSNMDTTSSIPSNAGYGSCVASTSAPVPTPPPICDTDDDKGFCLKVATDVGGHLYSSPPSEAVMQRLGYSKRNHSDNTGRTYGQLSTKKLFHYGEGKFATFRADGEGSIGVRGHTRHYIGEYGQADRWCKDLANMGFAGRKDWHLPYVHDNLESLWENNHGNMYKSLAWPVASAYWTGELGTYSGRYGAYATSLKSARSAVYWVEEDSLFVSCRSE
ncbi:hypothetical protein AT730_25690 (plasmid) [Vibrio alginolyticus]|nr:hypothetical protein AT730_25690 [Vibrio alginolyticus]